MQTKEELNLVDTIKGEINRMCVTDNIAELDTMALHARRNIERLQSLRYASITADTPQPDDDYFRELMDAVECGEMSDAAANQAWYEYINKQVEESDTPQTELWDKKASDCDLWQKDRTCIGCYRYDICKQADTPQTDCAWK